MLESYKIKRCCVDSINVVNLYDEIDNYLLRTSTLNDYNNLVSKIKMYLEKENDSYNKLTLQEVLKFESQIDLSNNNDNFVKYIFRIKNKLMVISDKKRNNSIVNKNLFPSLDYNLEFSIFDLINSKIAIDTQKLLTSKINSLTADNQDIEKYIFLLKDINKVYTVNYLNSYEVSEKLLIKNAFIAENISSFSFNDIENRIFEDNGVVVDILSIYNNIIFSSAINLLEIIEKTVFNANNILSIYRNLAYLSKLEIIINYLTKNQLLELLNNCNKKKISKILKNDINNKIKNKVLEK